MSRRRNSKTCVICGASFYAPPSSKRVTCSPTCSHLRRKQYTPTGGNWSEASREAARIRALSQETLAMGTAVALKSPKSGPFATNLNAKRWRIRSREGIEYEFNNLLLWARENAHLFDNAPATTIANGFYTLKRSMEGKTSRPTSGYKGWTICEVTDDSEELY